MNLRKQSKRLLLVNMLMIIGIAGTSSATTDVKPR